MILSLLSLITAAPASEFKPTASALSAANYTLCEEDAEAAVKKSGEGARIPSWEACLARAEASGDDDFLSMVQGTLAVLRFERSYGQLRESDPIRYARTLLATVARDPGAQLPMATIREQWLVLISDHEARNNIPLRQVSVRILSAPGLGDEDRAAMDEYLRRYAVSSGFKAPEGYSAEAADSDVFVQCTVEGRSGTLGDSQRATLYEEVVTISAPSVRYKKRGTRGEGIEVSGRADYVEQPVARDRAMDAAASAFSDELLLRVIGELFSTWEP